MAVNAEPGPNYGKIRVLELPRNTTIPGPVQVQNNIESDPLISSQLSLLRRGGSEVEVGNLLTLPVGGGLLYVEPIYVRAAQTDSFPLLRKVAVSFGSRTAMADTLDQALRSIFVGDTGNSNSNETDSGTVVDLRPQLRPWTKPWMQPRRPMKMPKLPCDEATSPLSLKPRSGWVKPWTRLPLHGEQLRRGHGFLPSHD